jgi:CDP-diglyceride synthetase
MPLDGGLELRGRPLFGAHKTVAGLLAMPLSAALIFPALYSLVQATCSVWHAALWPLTLLEWALLGAASGLAFMLAELPNSMLKRQLNIAPGALPSHPVLRWLCAVFDRFDSTLGVLLMLTWVLGVGGWFWLYALLLGPVVHAGFSAGLFFAGVKARPG